MKANKGYAYVKECCGKCTKKDNCLQYMDIKKKRGITSGQLMSMANCDLWEMAK